MTGEQLETFGHNDNALFPLRWRWNGHQGWFPLDFLFFGAVWRTSRRNFPKFSAKIKSENVLQSTWIDKIETNQKWKISLSLFRSYRISNDVDQWGRCVTSKQYKNNQKWTKKHQLSIQPSYSSNTESNMKVVYNHFYLSEKR